MKVMVMVKATADSEAGGEACCIDEWGGAIPVESAMQHSWRITRTDRSDQPAGPWIVEHLHLIRLRGRVPALRGEGRTLLVEDPERQRCRRLPVGGAAEPGHEADQGDENFCPAAHDFVGRSAFQCRAK